MPLRVFHGKVYSIKIKTLFRKISVLGGSFGFERDLTSIQWFVCVFNTNEVLDIALNASSMSTSEALPEDGSECHCACSKHNSSLLNQEIQPSISLQKPDCQISLQIAKAWHQTYVSLCIWPAFTKKWSKDTSSYVVYFPTVLSPKFKQI